MNNQTPNCQSVTNYEKFIDDCIQCRKYEKRIELLKDFKKDIDKISDMKSYYYTYGSVETAFILDVLTADDVLKLIKSLNAKHEMLVKGGVVL